METGNNSCCQIQKPVNTRYSCQIKTCIHNISHDSTHSVQSMYINNPDDCRLRREERNSKQSKRYDLTKCKQKGWNHTGVRSSILRHSLMFTLKNDKKKVTDVAQITFFGHDLILDSRHLSDQTGKTWDKVTYWLESARKRAKTASQIFVDSFPGHKTSHQLNAG